MAFTGAAVITKVSDRKFRITGLSLAAAAAGTIGLSQNAAAEVEITAPGWDRYDSSGVHGGLVELDDSIECRYCVAEIGLAVTEPLSIVKTGNGPSDFLLTLTNPDAAASGALEIWVEFH